VSTPAASASTPAASAAPATTASSFIGKTALAEPGQQILSADLDGDGSVEFVIVYGGGEGCLLARVAPGGGGPRLVPLLDGARLRAPSLGDADGDGTVDLVGVASGGEHFEFRKGLGSGAFAPPVPFPASDGAILPRAECAPIAPSLLDVRGDRRAELILAVPGGARLVSWPVAAATPADGPEELLGAALATASENGIRLTSPLPTLVGDAGHQSLVLGPLPEPGSPRLDMAWWARTAEGALEPRRTALALPTAQSAAIVVPMDIEDDGRPEIAVLTMPAHLQNFLGEFGLSVYRASDRTDAPVAPFFSSNTSINFWQQPSIALVPSPRGKDLLIGFYRGLVREHLNILVWRGDGHGSFEPKSREYGVDSGDDADRGFLLWNDVTGDGTVDLLTSGGGQIRVHRGTGGDRPVEEAPTAFFDLPGLEGGTISASMGAGGGIVFDYSPAAPPLLRDVDGDGRKELLTLEPDLPGTAPVAPEARPARRSGKPRPPAGVLWIRHLRGSPRPDSSR
jgi:hypothetical protein